MIGAALVLAGQAALVALGIVFLVAVVQGFNVPSRLKYAHLPGADPWWLAGNALELVVRHKGYLLGFYADYGARYGRLFKWWLGLTPVVTIRDAELARLVLVKHFRIFHDRFFFEAPYHPKRQQMFAASILSSRGKDWATVRSAAQPMFHTTGLQQYAAIMDDTAGRLLQVLAPAAASGRPVDVYKLAGAAALEVIGSSAFGVELHALDASSEGGAAGGGGGEAAGEGLLVRTARLMMQNQQVASQQLLALAPPIIRRLVMALLRKYPPPALRQSEGYRNDMLAASMTLTRNALGRLGMPWEDELDLEATFLTSDVAKQLRKLYADTTPHAGSLLDHLVQARHKETGQPLEAYRIVAQAQVFLLAGFETTQFVLTSALRMLADHPEVQRKLQAEVDGFGGEALTHEALDRFPYVQAVVNEVLRLAPSAPITSRRALEDIDVGGHRIPAGACVHIDLAGIQRDPAHWGPDTDAFRPERFLGDAPEARGRHENAFMPFGAGPRNCIGYKFALEEIHITLIRLVQALEFRVPPGAPDPFADMRFGITLSFRVPVLLEVHERKRGGGDGGGGRPLAAAR